MRPVLFDEALDRAVEIADDFNKNVCSTIVLRNAVGRIVLVLDDRVQSVSAPADAMLRVAEALGVWSASPGIILASEAIDAELLLAGPRLIRIAGSGRPVAVIERMLTGQDWLEPAFASPAGRNRVTFFGFKGGVGRTTAAIALAAYAARRGHNVLLVDLDLESPGLGPTLLRRGTEPNFGVADHLVEASVGQADRILESLVAKVRIPGIAGQGQITLAPAQGRSSHTHSYAAKLARAYVTAPPAGGAAARIERVVADLEDLVNADLTILDSRAGLDTIAAIAVTRMNALSLLFGVDTPQTWSGYSTLFQSWQGAASDVLQFRERCKAVAALLPELGTDAAFARHRDRALECFASYLYDEVGETEVSGFNFEPDDPDAPHYPLPIVWSEGLRAFDPLSDSSPLQHGPSWAALTPFCQSALDLAMQDSDA